MSHAADKLPQVITSGEQMRRTVIAARADNRSIGLVPTMGALHAGHLSLVKAATSQCDMTAVTIFVNPTQFGQGEDYEQYPRDLDSDLTALAPLGVDMVFAPAAQEIYQREHATEVRAFGVAAPLEGRMRPGHFAGVATIVLKLFNLIPADIAFFGQKDYQQALVVRQMVRDLNVPIEIHLCPTVRDKDGLALSSRNVYLSNDQRQQALSLSRSLQLAGDLVHSGQRNAAEIIRQMRELMRSAGDLRIDYVALADPDSLDPISVVDRPVIALVAARIGNTHLIDNELISPSPSAGG